MLAPDLVWPWWKYSLSQMCRNKQKSPKWEHTEVISSEFAVAKSSALAFGRDSKAGRALNRNTERQGYALTGEGAGWRERASDVIGLRSIFSFIWVVLNRKWSRIRETGSCWPSPDHSGPMSSEAVVWLPSWFLQELWVRVLLASVDVVYVCILSLSWKTTAQVYRSLLWLKC